MRESLFFKRAEIGEDTRIEEMGRSIFFAFATFRLGIDIGRAHGTSKVARIRQVGACEGERRRYLRAEFVPRYVRYNERQPC